MAGDRPMGEAAEEVGHDQAERQHALAEEEELEDGADDRQDDGVAIAQSVEDDESDGNGTTAVAAWMRYITYNEPLTWALTPSIR